MAEAISQADRLVRSVELFDIYRGESLGPKRKSLAVHLEFSRDDRTLTAEEADQAVEAIKRRLAEKFGAELRG